MIDETGLLKAATAGSVALKAGEAVRVVNLHGAQAVDAWAFDAERTDVFMSLDHTRVHAGVVTPGLGVTFLTNRRAPILRMTADTSPGVHDWFMAACDRHRYHMLGYEGLHANCTDNLAAVLAAHGRPLGFTPAPLNLFQNPVFEGDTLTIGPPVSAPGDHVELTALTDALVVFSACPQDMAPTNGADQTPRDVRILRV